MIFVLGVLSSPPPLCDLGELAARSGSRRCSGLEKEVCWRRRALRGRLPPRRSRARLLRSHRAHRPEHAQAPDRRTRASRRRPLGVRSGPMRSRLARDAAAPRRGSPRPAWGSSRRRAGLLLSGRLGEVLLQPPTQSTSTKRPGVGGADALSSRSASPRAAAAPYARRSTPPAADAA